MTCLVYFKPCIFVRYHAIAGRVKTDSDVESDVEELEEDNKQLFSCPELIHNLDMLIEETEMRILSVKLVLQMITYHVFINHY